MSSKAATKNAAASARTVRTVRLFIADLVHDSGIAIFEKLARAARRQPLRIEGDREKEAILAGADEMRYGKDRVIIARQSRGDEKAQKSRNHGCADSRLKQDWPKAGHAASGRPPTLIG